jgi:hypothetical protein
MSPLDLSANRALPYALRARVEFRDPENCLRRLCDHMREHGMHVHEDDGVFTVILPDVVGSLSKDGRYVTVEAAAADLEAFYFVKMWLQAEFSELAGHPAPLIEWNEESRNLRFPPSFRTLAVVTVRDITPRMRRITFKGNDLNRFDTLSALHLQLLINLGAVTEQCRRQCDFSDSETLQDAPVWRRYTVRSVDRARGTIDVDFFLHGSSGPGANWAPRLTGIFSPGTRPPCPRLPASSNACQPPRGELPLSKSPAKGSGRRLRSRQASQSSGFIGRTAQTPARTAC